MTDQEGRTYGCNPPDACAAVAQPHGSNMAATDAAAALPQEDHFAINPQQAVPPANLLQPAPWQQAAPAAVLSMQPRSGATVVHPSCGVFGLCAGALSLIGATLVVLTYSGTPTPCRQVLSLIAVTCDMCRHSLPWRRAGEPAVLPALA